MDQLSSMQVVNRFGCLVYDVPFMFLLENILLDQGVEIDVHELEN